MIRTGAADEILIALLLLPHKLARHSVSASFLLASSPPTAAILIARSGSHFFTEYYWPLCYHFSHSPMLLIFIAC
jgi:hypothetical protein